jgi:hypothetical protein
MKHLKRIFESKDVSLDQIKDIFQDLSDIVYLDISEEYFAENFNESLYTVIEIGDGNSIERIGYLIHVKTKFEIDNFKLLSNVFDCFDKSIQLVKSFDPSIEVYIRKTDSIVPDIYLLKEENGEEIANHQIKYEIDYVICYINDTPSKIKFSKHITSNVEVHKKKVIISFINKLEEYFFENFKHMWIGEVNQDCIISKIDNKIIIDFEDPLF